MLFVVNRKVYGTDTWPIDETVCIALAEEIGFDADLFWATLEDLETERVLAAAAKAAFRYGPFGVSTFFVGAQMLWGNERPTILKHVLKKRSSR
jgi:2-hydroxychromene-2-carboxylate isomerase